MPRRANVWRRADRGGDWYGRVAGTVILIARARVSKTEAQDEQARLARDQRTRRPVATAILVEDLLNLFLTHVESCVNRGELASVTHEGYERHLIPARQAIGSMAVAEIRPHHVTAWLDARRTWGPTTRANAVVAMKRAFRWARRAGYVDTSPLDGLTRPQPRRREAVLTADQLGAIVAAVAPDDPFRDLLIALRETGCRSKEVYTLTAECVDMARGVWIVANKTARATGVAARVVYLSETAIELSRRLLMSHPTGHLFRNTLGRPWTRNAVALRMRRLAAKLGLHREAAVSGLRHGFITDALEAGVPPATVAALVGHKDLTMISRVYSHLVERQDHLAEAARRTRPGGDPASGPGAGRSEGSAGP